MGCQIDKTEERRLQNEHPGLRRLRDEGRDTRSDRSSVNNDMEHTQIALIGARRFFMVMVFESDFGKNRLLQR